MQTLNDAKELRLTIRRGILDHRKRTLIIHPDFFQFEDKDLVDDSFTRFDREEITDFRYGINWISGYQFYIGREYQIYLLNRERKIIKVHFKSLYGIRKHEMHKLYSDIVNALWDFYFEQIARNHVDKIYSGDTLVIGDLQLNMQGVEIHKHRTVKPQLIPWEDLGTTNYTTYFAIYSKANSRNINRSYSYLNDWNTAILFSIVRGILIDKKFIES